MTHGSPLLVAVVMPTYKRPDLLARCLTALLGQTLASETYEIIVCDDGPSESTIEVVEAARARVGTRPSIRYLPITDTQGPAGARNAGWRTADAPIVAFTDDDTVPEPAWLEAGLAAMASGAEAATGRIIMPLPDRPTDFERDAARLQDAEFVTANCFVRRSALAAVEGFDERFTAAWREDSDLHFSLIERGYTVVSAPGAVVIHPLRPARFAAGLAMQKKVMFDVLLYLKHPRLYRERIRRRPPWFYLTVCASLALSAGCLVAGFEGAAASAFALWAALSALFFLRRLRSSSLSWRNVLELLATSALIPLLSIFWRVVGMARFGRALP